MRNDRISKNVNHTAWAILLMAAVSMGVAHGATIAYWRFEEGRAGAGANNQNNAILDISGNHLNGTSANSPVYRSDVPESPVPRTGEANHLSLDFNGTNQRIFVPDSPLFQLTRSMTLEASIKPVLDSNSTGNIIFRGDDRIGFDSFRLAVWNKRILFAVQDSAGNVAQITSPLLVANRWVSVAGTVDDAAGRINLYLDHVLVNAASTTIRAAGPLVIPEDPGVGIGNAQSKYYSEYFHGLMDEVRISDRALSPNQLLDVPETTCAGILMAALALLAKRPACPRSRAVRGSRAREG